VTITWTEKLSPEEMTRVQGFVRETSIHWREYFTEVGKTDDKVGVGFVVDGWVKPFLLVVDAEHPQAFLSDPKLETMPENWREAVREFVERAFELSAPGLFRIVLVHAKAKQPFIICFRLDLGNGAIQ
jgi:hypothetical protein